MCQFNTDYWYKRMLKCNFHCAFRLILGLLLTTEVTAQTARNPIIYADVPDLSMIRVGKTYYMSSTTMHMSPGVPLMKSTDLVNWQLFGYVYDTLANVPSLNLTDGKGTYGRGSWASCIKYHNGLFYVTTFAQTTGKTHVYSTKNIEKGPWKSVSFAPSLHDHSLYFDDDGRVYMIYGNGKIKIIELTSDVSGIKKAGLTKPSSKTAVHQRGITSCSEQKVRSYLRSTENTICSIFAGQEAVCGR